MREFRFGFNTSGLRPARELGELCRTAEEFGYDVVVSTESNADVGYAAISAGSDSAAESVDELG